MEGPLLTKSEQIVNTTIDGGSSSNAERKSSTLQSMTISHQVMSQEDLCTFNRTIHAAHTKVFWDLIEFVMDLVLIAAAIIVLIRTKGEHPEATWIICYTCGCILSSSPCFVLACFS
ncbi:hypothetical protein Bca52824_063109 [Brassica carinata]|uniref:Uncharacterized protein n=1 Tax=Brassica carinata TaxID=52824 RepID=A0A8X7QJ72_BRACI|nr:hypothetical protein Bca52824_063109 [Brassica carinata]